VAEDLGDFYRVRADKRDLNYDKYFVEGTKTLASDQEYNSHNTRLLTVDEIKKKLLELPFIRQELSRFGYLDEAALASE
jgi:UDP-glucose 4-epimerase